MLVYSQITKSVFVMKIPPTIYVSQSAYQGNYMTMKARQVTLTFLVTLFMTASSDLQFDNGHSKTGNTGGIDEVLRKSGTFSPAEEYSFLEAVARHAVDILGKDNLEKLLGVQPGIFSDSLSGGTSMMNMWSNLPAIARESILKKIFPFLSSRSSRGGNQLTLHCVVGRDFCRTDNNCNSKYEQFVSSCSSDEETILDPVIARKSNHNARTTKRRRQRKDGGERPIKRDVELVESRIRNNGKRLKKRRRKNKQKSVFWMGKRLSSKPSKSRDMQRYFSLHTKTYKCSLGCVQLLNLLNYTIYGALLAHCDCRANTMPEEYKNMLYDNLDISQRLIQTKNEYLQNWETTCFAHQKIAQVCRPRIYVGTKDTVGCTEVRKECENDPKCNNAQEQFVKECSKVKFHIYRTDF